VFGADDDCWVMATMLEQNGGPGQIEMVAVSVWDASVETGLPEIVTLAGGISWAKARFPKNNSVIVTRETNSFFMAVYPPLSANCSSRQLSSCSFSIRPQLP